MNTPRHTTDDAVPTRRRAFTKTELQHFFDVVDNFVDEQHRVGSKRWLTALRDSIAFKVGYAYGLRRRELVMLDLTDFGPNPHAPRFGDYGAMTVRWANGTTGSGPRRRTVLIVPEFLWAIELFNTGAPRAGSCFGPDRSPAFSHLVIDSVVRWFMRAPSPGNRSPSAPKR